MITDTHAVIRDGQVVDVAVIDAPTVKQWRDDGVLEQVWPGAELVDLAGVSPAPGIGWSYDGQAFTDPRPAPTPDPSPTA